MVKEFSNNIARPRIAGNFAVAQLEAGILAHLKIEMEKAVAEEIGEEYLLEAAASSSDIGERMGSSI
ncbi:hypothetical protein SDC9_205283 [bioreactor metagenome]|uniref:Uncharacterized protein n=1 Tax=bioreactor metagenome TaxID=1076179 RepID=A0A645J4G9_9ZZZZ